MMNLTKLSRYLSYILRHHPEAVGISLDEHGWANVEALIEGISEKKKGFDREILEEIVRTDEKQRYSFSEDGTRIRANQGHSVLVDVNLEQKILRNIYGTEQRRSLYRRFKRRGFFPCPVCMYICQRMLKKQKKLGHVMGNPLFIALKAGKWLRTDIVFINRRIKFG